MSPKGKTMKNENKKNRSEKWTRTLSPPPPQPTRPCVRYNSLAAHTHASRYYDPSIETVHPTHAHTFGCVSVYVGLRACLHSLLPFLFDRQHFFLSLFLFASATYVRLVELFVVCTLDALVQNEMYTYEFNSRLKSVAALGGCRCRHAACAVRISVSQFYPGYFHQCSIKYALNTTTATIMPVHQTAVERECAWKNEDENCGNSVNAFCLRATAATFAIQARKK